MKKRIWIPLSLTALVVLAISFRPYIWSANSPVVMKFSAGKTVAERQSQYGEAARARFEPYFTAANVPYPPAHVTFVGLKAEKLLQVYANDASGAPRFINSYPILAASGQSGPKLREGDRQVPEGIYVIESLNPNSRFHLALRIGYPNEFDREQARKEGRTNLGGDIMIHGSSVSVGCLAMGDEAAEDLFILAADTGLKNISVILSPVDFRIRNSPENKAPLPAWTESLYAQIKSQLSQLPPEKSK